MSERFGAVAGVLLKVLVLNLGVAAAKLVLGFTSGAVSVVSDGVHSLTDGLSNVAALVGVGVARRPPDRNHPYGHRKYETIAAAAIGGFLLIVTMEILETAWGRFRAGSAPTVTPLAFAVMIAAIGINLLVTRYERRAGQRLQSEVLLADAMHTQSDVWTSLTVIVALAASWLGYPALDPIAALVVVGFIGHAAWQILRSTSDVLSDHIVIPEAEVRRVVLSVPSVMGCQEIRTRGQHREHQPDIVDSGGQGAVLGHAEPRRHSERRRHEVGPGLQAHDPTARRRNPD